MGLLNGEEQIQGEVRLAGVQNARQQRTFVSLAALPSNIHAVEAALLFSAGMSPLVALVGPSGWGKSHLLDAVVHRLKQDSDEVVEYGTASDFLLGPAKPESAALVLDDVQEVLARPKLRLMLSLVLERRVRASKPTILAFTLPKVSRQLKSFLPSTREWVVATMDAPEPEERVLLVNQMAKAEGLSLSPALVRTIAIQMHGNGRTLAGAMKRLRLEGASWLSARCTLKACGLLEPFFADNSAWDLKHKILMTAEASRAQFSKAATLDIALYVMLHVATLSEADVARVAGVAPAEAYLRANRFAQQASTSPEMQGYVAQFVDTVVAALASE